MNGVHTLHTRSPAGVEYTMTVQQLISDGIRAYMYKTPPAVHLLKPLPVGAGFGIYLVTTDNAGAFAVNSLPVIAATNRAAFDRGHIPPMYPIFATTSHSEALERLTAYRAAAKAARKQQHASTNSELRNTNSEARP